MDALLKAVLLVGAALMVGRVVFARWIGPDLVTGGVRRVLHAGAACGAVLVVVGSVFDMGAALTRATGAFEPAVVPAYLAGTRHGLAIIGRVLSVAVLMWLSAAAKRSRPSSTLLGAAGLVLLGSFSVTSHAAGLQRATPVLMDLAHFTAAAAWGGALLYVAWLPVWPGPGHPAVALPHALSRISRLGFVSVLAIGFTGAAGALFHLWGPTALTGTPYGRTLLWKLVVVAAVVAVAAANRWAFMPALRKPGAMSGLRLLVRVESVLLILVFGMSGLLTSRPIPEAPPVLAQAVSFRERAGAWTVRGSLSPTTAGGFDLEFSVLDARGAPPDLPVEAAVALTMRDHPMAPVTVRPSELGRGSYRARVLLPMAGRWQLTIRVTGVSVAIELSARGSSAPASGVAWARVLPGLIAFLLGASFVLLIMQRDMRPVWRWSAAGSGFALMVVGLALSARVLTAAAPFTGAVDRPNPVPPTAASITAGERVYRRHCQACHGVIGAGDGPASFALRPRPADLRVHMAAGHTDGQLHYWISGGFPGTAMPAFKDALSDEERWNVVNFIRTFALTDR